MMVLRRRDFERVEVQPASTVDGKRVMPIEQALVWAYQTELCAASEAQMYGSGWNMERVDCSTSSAWLAIADAAAASAVSPDAKAIHERVQELDDPSWLAIDDLTGLLASTYVSLSEPAYFEAAFPRARELVITYARLGKLPDISGAPRPYPVRADNGEVLVRRVLEFRHKTIDQREVTDQAEQVIRDGVTYAEARGKPTRGKYPQGSFCLIKYAPDWDEVVRERAEYLVWWLALRWLSDNLDHLERHVVTPPELPMRPWQVLDASGSLDIQTNR